MTTKDKLLIVQVAALGHEWLQHTGRTALAGFQFHPVKPVFPALTCPFQASFRTGLPPEQHGITANGRFSRSLCKTAFWEQSAHQVNGPRIWESYRQCGNTVAMLFWQQSLGESADFILSPAPIHKHHGGMIQDCYSKPGNLYPMLLHRLKRPFNLMHYWGPMASRKAGDWIAEATCEVMRHPDFSPNLCLTYLPTLDYDLQRYGPSSPQALRALTAVFQQLERVRTAAEQNGYRMLIIGDYAIGEATRPIMPNRILREKGLLKTRAIRKMTYPDLYDSPAFVLTDHEVAQVFVRNRLDLPRVLELLGSLDGIESVQPLSLRRTSELPDDNTPDAILQARPGSWFAYSWWDESSEAPDYARHVDIHSKPGYDPCELFWGWPPGSVSLNNGRIRGSHGRADRPAALATDLPELQSSDTMELVEAVTRLLNRSLQVRHDA